MTKRNSILLALLLLQLGVIAIFSLVGRNDQPPQVVFFAGLEPSRITGLSITGEEERSTVLRKTDSGWLISSEGDLPADPAKIDTALKTLTALKAQRLVTRTRESHNRFLVGEKKYLQRITLTLADGQEQSIYLGTAPSYKSTHLRAAGDDRVYLVNDFSAWDLPPEASAWWLADYVDLPDDGLAEVRITNAQGILILKKDGNGAWRLQGLPPEAIDPAKTQALVDGARRITLSEYLGRENRNEYGLNPPAASVTLVGKSGETTLLIGAKDAAGSTSVLKSSASPFYVRASNTALTGILAARADGLLGTEEKKDETPTGGAP
ncbi:DUF4340 domain-containing protein [Thiovibrio sp. JS02]